MKTLAWLLMLGFFGKINTNRREVKPRSVNLALETILEFDRKDNAVDIHFIDQVQEFLDKLKHVIRGRHSNARRTTGNGPSFTEFLARALEIIKNYNDDDFSNVLTAIDDEARKFHYKGCKFHELLENHEVRRFMANKLEEIKGRSIKNIRKNINNAIEFLKDDNLNVNEKKFINSLYKFDGTGKLEAFLNDLESYSNKYKRSDTNIVNILRNGMRSVFFDHFSKLNPNVRNDLKVKIETFWKNSNEPSKTIHNVWSLGHPTSTVSVKPASMARILYSNPQMPKTQSTTKNIETTTKSAIKDDINRFYDKIELLKTIKQYINADTEKKQAKSSLEENNAYHERKKKNKRHETSEEISDEKHTDSDEEKGESKKKKHKKQRKHKRQRKHKKKDKKKPKHKPSIETVESIDSSEQKPERQREIDTISDSDSSSGIDRNTKMRRSKIKVTAPTTPLQHVWREKEKKHATDLRTEVRQDSTLNNRNQSQESLEGNEKFNRERQMTDVESPENKSFEDLPKAKEQRDSRKWYKEEGTKTSLEGISIENYELQRNHSTRKQNNNFTSNMNKTITDGGPIDIKFRAVEDKTQKAITEEVTQRNDVTYADLDFWEGTKDFGEYIPKVANATNPGSLKANLTTTTERTNINDTIKEINRKVLNKTKSFSNMRNNTSGDAEVKSDGKNNGTFAARTQLVLDSFLNQSQALNTDQKHKYRLKMREDLHKILGKTTEPSTTHDVFKFTDPLQDFEDDIDLL